MQNGYKVILSKRAINDLKNIGQYLTDNWSEKEIIKFHNSLDKAVTHIQRFPTGFPYTVKKKGIRRYVLSKRHSLYYTFEENTILITAVSDNRQKAPTF
jgi:plasmid stabilization system protein ParE